MKNKIGLILCLVLLSLNAIASKDRGGGDMCEDRIKSVRADIGAWIDKGGHVTLKLPDGISSSVYSSEMKRAVEKSQIECVSRGDKNYPVEVYGRSKVCRFDSNEMLITCDFDKVSKTNEEELYRLVHHELAGLAGIENSDQADSHYEVSNQISRYLVDTVIKRLAILPTAAVRNNEDLRQSARFGIRAAGLYYCFQNDGAVFLNGFEDLDKILADTKRTTFKLIKDKKRPRIEALQIFDYWGPSDGQTQFEFLVSKDMKSILSMTFVTGQVRTQTVNTGTITAPKYETQRYLFKLQSGYCRAASIQEGVFPK